MAVSPGIFQPWLDQWLLEPDGSVITTRSSRLLPVLRGTTQAILKIAIEPEEAFGHDLMAWWNGDGAASVLAHDGAALLLERATESRSLVDLVRHGHDREAVKIICATAARLHLPKATPPPRLIPLEDWFDDLYPAASKFGGILPTCAATARTLLATTQDIVPLHGDIHHGNILDFAKRGWLAIDPKGLRGDRLFDYANLFCNPDHETATDPDGFESRVESIMRTAVAERQRLLQWILAWAGLSASWLLLDGHSPRTALSVATMAQASLRR